MIITFTDTTGCVLEQYKPKPASSVIPDWYKTIDSYENNKKNVAESGRTNGTIKKCMPVFDAIVCGYIIFSPCDVWVTQRKDEQGNTFPYFQWPSFDVLSFHPVWQAPNHPKSNNTSYPKWNNPWSIKTPKGYSILITAPLHRQNIFTCLEAVVDTDKYDANINFPFVLNDNTFEGLIPAGTPLVQVIPFKRDKWKMQFGNKKNIKNIEKTTTAIRVKIFDAYKTFFRQVKEYK